MNRYGGNTSCVQAHARERRGARSSTRAPASAASASTSTAAARIHILLTHLHLDHIQGLMFFPPCFRPESEITIWGPSSPEASLEDRIGRYISAPLSPVEVRELPCSVSFRDTPATEWQLGGATIRAEAVTHRGPTLGYRITDGDTTLAYIPDHEPALGAPARRARARVDLRLRPRPRRRPADPRLPVHRRGVPRPRRLGALGRADTLTFARRVEARRLLLFHHDPLHSDEFLDEFCSRRARRLGGGSAATPPSSTWAWRAASSRSWAPPPADPRPVPAYKRSGPKFRHSDNEASAARIFIYAAPLAVVPPIQRRRSGPPRTLMEPGGHSIFLFTTSRR